MKRRKWLRWVIGVAVVLAVGVAITWRTFGLGLAWEVLVIRVAPPGIAKTFSDGAGGTLPYRLVLPPGYRAGETTTRYPLLISLHGSGEEGSDNIRQMHCLVPWFLAPEVRWRYPCFVLAPQCTSGTRWVDFRTRLPDSYRQAKEPTAPTRLLLALIPRLEAQYAIDPARVYVVGYSSGGYGVWDVLTRRPELFAAGVIFSGVGDPRQVKKIVDMPVWVFHGAKDTTVPVACAHVMVNALQKAGGHPRYTEYPDLGHSVVPTAFRDPALLPWLFAQHQ